MLSQLYRNFSFFTTLNISGLADFIDYQNKIPSKIVHKKEIMNVTITTLVLLLTFIFAIEIEPSRTIVFKLSHSPAILGLFIYLFVEKFYILWLHIFCTDIFFDFVLKSIALSISIAISVQCIFHRVIVS